MKAFTAHTVIVVQLRIAGSQRNVQVAGDSFGVAGDCAERSADVVGFLFSDFVTDEVGGRIGLLLENTKVTIQFLAQDAENLGLSER